MTLASPSHADNNGIDSALYHDHLSHALSEIGLTIADLSLPKLGIPYSTPGRLRAVDSAMKTPLWMVDTGSKLSDLGRTEVAPSDYLARVLSILGYSAEELAIDIDSHSDGENEFIGDLESAKIDPAEKERLRELITRLSDIALSYLQNYPDLDPDVEKAITGHIQQLVRDTSIERNSRWLSLPEYHHLGAKFPLEQQAGYLLACLSAIEEFVVSTRLEIDEPITWDTPLGKILIAAGTDDTHTGHYFLLIDTGGNDTYHDVGTTPPKTGFTFVIDLNGNDRVTWDSATGPGAGVFGIGVWVDWRGSDIYQGRNAGIGAGLLGAGALWDADGDDLYISGSLSQGAGQYGIGVLIDEKGNDRFVSELSSQGYGGTGGLGILVNHDGNDHYLCGNAIPDQAEDRVARHADRHYISMCQGYSFGQRPDISGGIGLLIDHAGDDVYEADIFAQGASYWFGLGMLIDSRGNDKYLAFEHAQGAGLHLGAAFLGDFAGNDRYLAYEHSQGVGIDRAIGILLDVGGDDRYVAVQEAQGAGIKPYGFGILIDSEGNDHYASQEKSQGYSAALPKDFPEQQRPVGILLDLEGKDTFEPSFTSSGTSKTVRIQNSQGVAIDFTEKPQGHKH